MYRIARFAVIHGAKKRAIAILGAFSIGDFFVPALPTQTSVIALGLMQPKRALWIALAFATSAAVGAAIVGLLLTTVASYATEFSNAQLGKQWQQIASRVREWGVWAVLIASIFPTPPRLLTAASILSGVAVGAVVGAVFLGKLIWFSLFLALLVFAPHWLSRVPVLGKSIQRFHQFRDETLRSVNQNPAPDKF
jgi:membrane protein YqaA with SNARE-associated domain